MQGKNEKKADMLNLKVTTVIIFVLGLVTVYSIMPENITAIVGYSIVVGGGLFYYAVFYNKKQTSKQDAASSYLESLQAKMEADEVRLAETEQQIAQMEADWTQVQAELAAPSDMTVERWLVLCNMVEEAAFATKQGQQYKKLMSIFSGKKEEDVLRADGAEKTKHLYQTIYTRGLESMKKRLHGEKNVRADIKANIEKDIRRTKKKRRE